MLTPDFVLITPGSAQGTMCSTRNCSWVSASKTNPFPLFCLLDPDPCLWLCAAPRVSPGLLAWFLVLTLPDLPALPFLLTSEPTHFGRCLVLCHPQRWALEVPNYVSLHRNEPCLPPPAFPPGALICTPNLPGPLSRSCRPHRSI